MKSLFVCIILFGTLLSLNKVFAQTLPAPTCENGSPSTQLCNPVEYAADYKAFIFHTIEVLTGFFLLIPVMRIAFAGFQMITSRGDSEAIAKAKTNIQWTVISIVIALFAFVIVQAIANFIGEKDLSGSFSGNNPVQNPIAADNFTALLTQMLTGFLGIIGLLALLMIIFGGFQYITSSGNEEQAESAKGTIQWSVIGLIVALLSYVIIRATVTFFAK